MLIILIKIFMTLTLLYVWLLRKNSPSPFRAGESLNLKQEFAFYGLSKEMFYLIGTLKILFSLTLFGSLWLNQLSAFSSIGISVLMLGAFFFHLKVGDKLYRSIPSLSLSLLSIILLFNWQLFLLGFSVF